MFFFDSLFKKKVEKENISHSVSTEASAPEIHYVIQSGIVSGLMTQNTKFWFFGGYRKKRKGMIRPRISIRSGLNKTME